jgi:transposase
MVTTVRRRRVWELHARRGRNIDTPYQYRKLLTCAADRLSVRQRARLTQILEQDIELAVAWGIKEHVRQLLAARDTSTFQREWAALTRAVRATRLPEPVALFKTLTAWRGELLTFARTRVTNARSEAANLTAKTFKRIGRGYRNHDNYRRRIIGYAPRPIAA